MIRDKGSQAPTFNSDGHDLNRFSGRLNAFLELVGFFQSGVLRGRPPQLAARVNRKSNTAWGWLYKDKEPERPTLEAIVETGLVDYQQQWGKTFDFQKSVGWLSNGGDWCPFLATDISGADESREIEPFLAARITIAAHIHAQTMGIPDIVDFLGDNAINELISTVAEVARAKKSDNIDEGLVEVLLRRSVARKKAELVSS